jgi:metal-responsive CopG/Arc/MetJ family transcriptional regulator
MDRSLSIRIDSDLARRLDDEAKRTHVSRGEIVREAVRKRLKTMAGPRTLLLKYAGVMSGPRDLSTNKKYLASLGRRKARK